MSEMTSLQRALSALERREPDRIPLFELLIDHRVTDKILPGSSYEDFAEYVGLDLVLTHTPSRLYEQKMIDENKRIVRDEWGILRQYTEQEVPIPLEGPIKSEEDLKRYVPPDPQAERRFSSLERLVGRFKGKKAVGIHLHDSFNYPWYLRGMENLLMDLMLNPDMVRELVRISVEHNIALAQKALELGADFVVLGDDYGSSMGPLMSPAQFEEFFLPGLREVVKAIKDKGAYCIKHCCGDINVLLDMIVGTGIDALHPLDAAAGMDIGAVKQKYGNRICVIGGVDCGDLLSSDPPERVVEEVKRVLRKVSPGGGHILSSSNSIHHSVKPENYLAMVETAKKYGKYPIRIN